MEPFCLLAASRPWYAGEAATLARESGMPFYQAATPLELERLLTGKPNPLYSFFPHWSWILPEAIWSRHECVMFHMTDLPFGRGGSPLQNLIARGFAATKISAFRCEAGVDAGPIYLKSDLSLYGGAEEIFLRAKRIMHGMILKILQERPAPQPQQGDPVHFPRRTAEDGDIGNLDTLEKIYDYIRMLDADGYPSAFLKKNGLRLEFRRAALRNGHVHADVTFSLQGEEE